MELGHGFNADETCSTPTVIDRHGTGKAESKSRSFPILGLNLDMTLGISPRQQFRILV